MQYKRIRELRKEGKMTQRQVAGLLQICYRSYCRYERGETDIPLDVSCGLAKLYHTSLDYLAGITDERIPHKKIKDSVRCP